MAEVDFSNAHIEITNTTPLQYVDVALLGSSFYKYTSSGRENVTYTLNRTIINNTSNNLTYQFTGQFITSGTDFYFYINTGNTWHITDITYNAWDTFNFKISANII